MCVAKTGVLSLSLSGSGWDSLSIYVKGLPAVLEGMGRLVCLRGCTKNAISAPKLADVFGYLYRIGLAWCTIGIYHSAISAFLEPHHLHKALHQPVISKVMHHFYLQCPPPHDHFYHWDVEYLLCLLEGLALASSLTTFKLVWKTATLLACVTAKHCSDLHLLCIDNQHLFLQHHPAISFPYLVARQINQVIFLLRFTLSLILMLIFALFCI